MRIAILSRLLIIPTTLACLGAAPAVFSQTSDEGNAEEKLETIQLDVLRGVSDEAITDDQFEDLVFDEATQSYHLIKNDEGDDSVEPPPDREVQARELQRLFQSYREALNNKDYPEADTLAKRVVELSIKLNGLDSHDSAKALTNLGIAQHNNGDYETAMRNFLASIDIIERIDDNLSEALVNPLRGLAATQAAIGRPDLANKSFQRAVHVTHVNYGPHNHGQVKILESMAELYLSQEDFKKATQVQEHIFAVQSRNIDPLSLDMIPALTERAQWQHRLQRYTRERSTWRQVINISERHYGKTGIELIGPLTNLGRSFLFVAPVEFDYQPEVSPGSGETYLKRAYRIAQENPDSTWQLQEGTILALGDYYILSGRPNRASRVYAEAWALLTAGDDPVRLKARRNNLEKVRLLQKVYPPRYYNSLKTDTGERPPDNFDTGTMSFSFTVSPSGRVTDLVHIETQPSEITEFDEAVGRSLRRLVYRPRIVDGKMAATPGMIYTHEFFYRPTDLAKLKNEGKMQADSAPADPASNEK